MLWLLALLQASSAMLTPLFSVTQDDASISITMRTPYVRAEELEIDVVGSAFTCHVRPYYLSLNFKQRLQQGGEKVRWDVDRGEMTVEVKKETPGQHFDNLDMLTELLTQPKTKAGAPAGGSGIEVLEEKMDAGANAEAGGVGAATDSDDEEEEDVDWRIPQKLPEPEAAEVLLKQSKYGFNDRHQGVFAVRQEYQTDIIDLKNADSVPAAERAALRIAQEDGKFVEEHEHYLCDTLGGEEEPLPSILAFVCPWEDAAAASVEAKRGAVAARAAGDEGGGTCGGGPGGGSGGGGEVTEEREVNYVGVDAQSKDLKSGDGTWGGGLGAEQREVLLKLPRRQFLLSREQVCVCVRARARACA